MRMLAYAQRLRRPPRPRRSGQESGLALITVLSVIFVLSLLAVLVMYLTGKEIILARGQQQASDAFYLADGGATVAREALYPLIENINTNAATIAGGQTALSSALSTMYGTGSPPQPSSQNPLKLLDYAGFSSNSGACCSTVTFGATAGTANESYLVINASTNYPTMYVEAYPGSDQFLSLGDGSYTAEITISPRLVTSANYPSGTYIEQAGPSSFATYTFHYTYTIVSRGVSGNDTRRVQVSNNFDVVVSPGSFADYAYFLDYFGQAPTNGQCTANGYFTSLDTFNGPVFTNGRMQLAGDPTFNGSVSQADYSFSYSNGQCVAGTQASSGLVQFYNNGNPQQVNYWCSPPPPNNNPCSVDNPTYAQGGQNFNRLASFIPMPANAYSQVEAAIGGNPNNTAAVTNQQINQALGLCSSSCSSNAPANGVYLASSTSGSTKTLTGGIYVQDSNLTGMAFSLDSNNNQVITITQSNPSSSVTTQVTTITIEQGSNQTVVSTQQTSTSGGQSTNSATYAGTPNGMVYVSGAVAALGGRTESSTSSCPSDSSDLGQNSSNSNLVGSCIQSNTEMTVAAGGNINIDENLRYQTQPPSSGTQPNNILGVYSAGGNVMITNAPQVLTTDAFLMSSTGSIGVTNYNSVFQNGSTCSGQSAGGCWTLLGGKIGYYAGDIGTFSTNRQGQVVIQSGYSTTMTFDQRTINNGIVPPYFPVAQLYGATFPGLTTPPSWQELF